MPDEEPEPAVASKDLIPAGGGAAEPAPGIEGQSTSIIGADKPQMSTPDKAPPGRINDVMASDQQRSLPPGALPALLQVVEIKGSDGQPHYQVVEATPPPPMQVAAA